MLTLINTHSLNLKLRTCENLYICVYLPGEGRKKCNVGLVWAYNFTVPVSVGHAVSLISFILMLCSSVPMCGHCLVCPLSNNSQFMVKSHYGVFLWHHLYCFGFCSVPLHSPFPVRIGSLCIVFRWVVLVSFALNADGHNWLSFLFLSHNICYVLWNSSGFCFCGAFLSSLYWWSFTYQPILCKKMVICPCF